MSEIYRQYESAAAQCADAGGLLELQKKLLLPIIAEALNTPTERKARCSIRCPRSLKTAKT